MCFFDMNSDDGFLLLVFWKLVHYFVWVCMGVVLVEVIWQNNLSNENPSEGVSIGFDDQKTRLSPPPPTTQWSWSQGTRTPMGRGGNIFGSMIKISLSLCIKTKQWILG